MTTNTDFFNSDPFEDVFFPETDSTPFNATLQAQGTDLFSSDIFGSDPFADFNEQIDLRPLQNRVEPIAVQDSDQYIGDMIFSKNPLEIFHSIPSSNTRQEVLRKMLSIETFRDLLLVEENYKTFKDPQELSILQSLFISHMNSNRDEYVEFNKYAASCCQENSIFLDAIYCLSLELFLANAESLPMSPETENRYIDRLLKKDLESALTFVVHRNAHPHLLKTTDFEKLTPYLSQTSKPFSIESLRQTISSSTVPETEKDQLLHLLAQEKEGVKSNLGPLEIGSKDPKATVDYAIEIAKIDPLKVLLEIENLNIRSASDRSKIAEVLAEKISRNHPQLSQNAKENLQIFLNEVLALRLENKKTALMKKICKASTADLELLFKDLPLNQEKKKAKSCYVVCVFARFIRQSPDSDFEQKLAKNAKTLRDNIHTQAAVKYLNQISSLNRSFTAQDIHTMISQLVYKNESIAERIPLLLTILDLNGAELHLHGPLSLEQLKALPRNFAHDLFHMDKEKSDKILDYFEKSRSPQAILLFMAKMDNLHQKPLRSEVLKSSRELLETIANGTYDTWRYENSPHIQEMLARGAMSEELLGSWKGPHTQISLDDKRQIDLSSDPTDFLLTGDECGGCQRLTLEPYDISAILGLMDGAFKMVVVRDKESGKMISRAFVRWMLDKETNKPVLLLEPTYTLNTSHSYREEILQYIESYANHIGVDLVVSPHFSNSYGVKGRSRKYGHEIHSLGSTAPLVFSDTYGYENGSGGTKTDGNYSLKDVLKVDPALDDSISEKL